MTFPQAVRSTPAVAGALKPGLRALRRRDRDRVSAGANSVTGSLDLDKALSASHPNEPVWDYGLGATTGKSERVVWLEIHPANSGHVDEVLRKLEWLLRWLANDAPVLGALDGEYVWVSSGPTSVRPGTPQHRKVASRGLRLVGGHFRIA